LKLDTGLRSLHQSLLGTFHIGASGVPSTWLTGENRTKNAHDRRTMFELCAGAWWGVKHKNFAVRKAGKS
jgi:hypothetical protein